MDLLMERAAEDEGRWITINGNAVKISDDGTMLTGPMKGQKLDSSDYKRSEPDKRSSRVLDEVNQRASSIKHRRVKNASRVGANNLGEWYRDGMGQAAYGFSVSGGREYEILVTRDAQFEGVDVESDFLQFLDENDSYKVTGAGKAHEVFSQVVPATVSYIKEAKPSVLTFTAAEPSRQRLYDRLVKVASATLPEYKAYSQDDESSRRYVVVHRSARSKLSDLLATSNLSRVESVQQQKGRPWQEIEPEIDPAWFEPEGWEDEEPSEEK
jgi:hypothetical protein